MTIDEFLSELDGVKPTRKGHIARCPAHEDRSPSLSVAEGDDGRILVRCWTGCTADKIMAALGLGLSDLFPGERDNYANSWEPKTAEERRAYATTQLRRKVRHLERENRTAFLALQRASLLVAIAYKDDQAGVIDRLWRGAVDQIEAEASALADAAA